MNQPPYFQALTGQKPFDPLQETASYPFSGTVRLEVFLDDKIGAPPTIPGGVYPNEIPEYNTANE